MSGSRPPVAVVLGATGTVGSEVTSRLVAAGHRVVAVARSEARLLDLCQRLDPTGAAALPLVADVRSVAAAQQIIAASTAAFGEPPTVVIQSTARFSTGALTETSDEEAHAIVDTMATGVHRLISALFADATITSGHVVVINSLAALAFNSSAAVYSLAQMASRTLTDSLRTQLNPRGIRVTSVFSGRILGPLQERLVAEEGRELLPDHLLEGTDVVEAVFAALGASHRAEITDITIRPMRPYPQG